MKNIFDIRNLIILVLLLLIGAGGFFYIEYKKQMTQVMDALNVQQDSTKHLKTKEGTWIARDRQSLLTIAQLKKHGQDLGFELEQIKKKVGGNLNNLKGYTSSMFVLGGHAGVLTHDTILFNHPGKSLGINVVRPYDNPLKGKKFAYSNSFLSVTGVYIPILDSLKFDYSYHSKFTYTSYSKRLKPFSLKQIVDGDYNPRSLIVDIEFDDPNAKAADVTSLTILPKKKTVFETNGFKFSIGFAVGAFAIYQVTH